jgi:chromosome segregation ATPase
MNFRDIEDFFTVLMDPVKYKAMVDDFVSRQTQLEALIEQAGVIGTVQELKEKIASDKESMDQEKEAHQQRLDHQRQMHEERIAREKQDSEDALRETKEKKQEAIELNKQYKEQLKELAAMKKEADIRMKGIQEMELDVQNRLAEVQERLSKLKSVMV